MSPPLQSEPVTESSNGQVRVPAAAIENVAEELHRALNSIQAIAYYVEMTLPLSELSSLEYLRKLQELVDECGEILKLFAEGCRAARSVAGEEIETNSNTDICSESRYVNAQGNGTD